MRFINNCRAQKTKSTTTSISRLEPLTVSELHTSENWSLRYCQYSAYRADIANIKSKYIRLSLVRLFLDDTGDIR